MFALYHGSVSACTFLDLQHNQPPRDIRKHGFVKLGKKLLVVAESGVCLRSYQDCTCFSLTGNVTK